MSVALINMPFGCISRPSLGIGLLKAILVNQGINCDVHYLNLDFYDLIGAENYRLFTTEVDNPEISITNKLLTGEWLFSNYFYQTKEQEKKKYIDYLVRYYYPDKEEILLNLLKSTAKHIPDYIDHCLNKLNWDDYRIVGVSSMFEQTYSSLVLAREIKKKHPQILIGFGGANCESSLGDGLINMFPFIDFVSIGEADVSFPELAQRILNNKDNWPKTKGYVTRNGQIINNGPSDPVILDHNPTPDYEDYFEKTRLLKEPDLTNVCLLMETSRGCWWGEKHHCTFCSINGNNIKHRKKSINKVIQNIETLSQKHGINRIEFTDNVLDNKSRNELTDYLINKGGIYDIFIETKSNLTRNDVYRLMLARINSIQPGIENFSDNTLRLMNKGTKGLSNLALIKFCRIYNVRLSWNFIFGFPDEDVEEFEWFYEVFQNIVHFEPPISLSPIRLDKFSPNYIQAEEKGIINVRPLEPYFHVFKEENEKVDDIAFYYDFDYKDERKPIEYSQKLHRFWQDWKQCKTPGSLYLYKTDNSKYELVDSRYTRKKGNYKLEENQAVLYSFCDSPRSVQNILKKAKDKFNMNEQEVNRFLMMMLKKGFIAEQNNSYVSLAIISDQLMFNLINIKS